MHRDLKPHGSLDTQRIDLYSKSRYLVFGCCSFRNAFRLLSIRIKFNQPINKRNQRDRSPHPKIDQQYLELVLDTHPKNVSKGSIQENRMGRSFRL